MADPLRTLFGGFVEPIPQGAPGSLRGGYVLWRVALVLLPLYLFMGGLAAQTAGEDMRAEADAIMNEPFLIFLTLGLVLFLALFFYIFAAIFMFVGWTMWFLGPVLFFVSVWWLGSVLRGPSRGYAALWVTMLLVLIAGTMGATAATYLFVDDWGMPRDLEPLLYAALIVPLAALIMVLHSDSRRWLNGRREAVMRRPEWIRLPSARPPR